MQSRLVLNLEVYGASHGNYTQQFTHEMYKYLHKNAYMGMFKTVILLLSSKTVNVILYLRKF